jgi:hypothetical protein
LGCDAVAAVAPRFALDRPKAGWISDLLVSRSTDSTLEPPNYPEMLAGVLEDEKSVEP